MASETQLSNIQFLRDFKRFQEIVKKYCAFEYGLKTTSWYLSQAQFGRLKRFPWIISKHSESSLWNKFRYYYVLNIIIG